MSAQRLEDKILATVDARVGSAKMSVSQIRALQEGTIIEFATLPGEPFSVYVNDKLIGHGEVIVIDGHFGIRMTHLEQK